MLRLRKYLINAGVWSEDEESAWVAECGTRVDEEVNLYLNTPVQPVEAMFDFLYADPPPDLLAQRARRSPGEAPWMRSRTARPARTPTPPTALRSRAEKRA